MKILAIMLAIALIALQYRAWFGDLGHFHAKALAAQLQEQQRRAEQQKQRNRILTAEVLALKKGHAAVEARARNDLGMIGEGETFYVLGGEASANGAGEAGRKAASWAQGTED